MNDFHSGLVENQMAVESNVESSKYNVPPPFPESRLYTMTRSFDYFLVSNSYAVNQYDNSSD